MATMKKMLIVLMLLLHFFRRLKPEIRYLVYCTHVKYGHSDSWEFLLAQYQENWHSGPDAVERGRMRDALACSRQTWILDR